MTSWPEVCRRASACGDVSRWGGIGAVVAFCVGPGRVASDSTAAISPSVPASPEGGSLGFEVRIAVRSAAGRGLSSFNQMVTGCAFKKAFPSSNAACCIGGIQSIHKTCLKNSIAAPLPRLMNKRPHRIIARLTAESECRAECSRRSHARTLWRGKREYVTPAAGSVVLSRLRTIAAGGGDRIRHRRIWKSWVSVGLA